MTHPLANAALRVCAVCEGSGLVSTADPYRPERPRSVSPCPRCEGAGHHLYIRETP